MAIEKYRVHEVAKDFKTTSKVITQILTDYATTPKNHMQVLETAELDIIFEYLTQHNQIDSIEQVYADVYHEPEAKKEPAPKAEGRPAAPHGEKKDQAKPAQGQGARPAPQPQPQRMAKRIRGIMVALMEPPLGPTSSLM